LVETIIKQPPVRRDPAENQREKSIPTASVGYYTMRFVKKQAKVQSFYKYYLLQKSDED